MDFVCGELVFNRVRIEGLTAPPGFSQQRRCNALGNLPEDCAGRGLARLRETVREEGLYQAEVLRKNSAHEEKHRWTSSCTSSLAWRDWHIN